MDDVFVSARDNFGYVDSLSIWKQWQGRQQYHCKCSGNMQELYMLSKTRSIVAYLRVVGILWASVYFYPQTWHYFGIWIVIFDFSFFCTLHSDSSSSKVMCLLRSLPILDLTHFVRRTSSDPSLILSWSDIFLSWLITFKSLVLPSSSQQFPQCSWILCFSASSSLWSYYGIYSEKPPWLLFFSPIL